MIETQPRTLRDKLLAEGATPIEEQYAFTARAESLGDLIYHLDCELDRLVLLDAFRTAAASVLEEYLEKDSSGTVLEVGCGRGYFENWLAPDWLKGRLVSFDINRTLLRTAAEHNPNPKSQHIEGSAYALPFEDQSLEAVIGYSSFDSLCFLREAILEVRRVLKPRGRLILFQDLTTDLYENMDEPREDQRETVERYHRLLCQTVKEEDFRILGGTGQTEFLSAVGVEKGKEIRRRVPDFEFDPNPFSFPIVAFADRGHFTPPLRRKTREVKTTRLEVEGQIRKWWEEQGSSSFIQGIIKETKAGPGDVVQFITMRCLVAEKT